MNEQEVQVNEQEDRWMMNGKTEGQQCEWDLSVGTTLACDVSQGVAITMLCVSSTGRQVSVRAFP